MSIYRQGRISVENGSNVVTGHGTRWVGYASAGDQITIEGTNYTIEAIVDNHLLNLTAPYLGDTGEQLRYAIERQQQPESLESVKTQVSAEVDRLAGIKRLQYITVSPGQEATYLDKFHDAKAYVDAGYPANSEPFIYVHEEALSTGMTPAQVADLIIYTAGIWRPIGAKIEGARQAAKRAIASANTTQQVNAALGVFTQSLNAI